MPNINEIYRMLNWKNPSKVQSEGIRFAQEIKDLSLLIQPPSDPSVWEQCASIIYKKSDTELEPYLDELLEWLQDLNWPGAITIAERLKKFSGEKLKKPVENAIAKSNKMTEHERMMWLNYLSELLENNILAANLSEEALTSLKKHDNNSTE